MKKTYFLLIIKVTSSKMTNRFIIENIIKNHEFKVCEFFNKNGQFTQCFNCQKYGHIDKMCKNVIKCEHCAKRHISADCNEKGKRCAVCKQDGHEAWSYKCKKRQDMKTVTLNKKDGKLTKYVEENEISRVEQEFEGAELKDKNRKRGRSANSAHSRRFSCDTQNVTIENQSKQSTVALSFAKQGQQMINKKKASGSPSKRLYIKTKIISNKKVIEKKKLGMTTIFYRFCSTTSKIKKNIIMTFLLADSNVQKLDILVIQKFWRNAFVLTSYNSRSADFYLAYNPIKNTKICFYINERIDPESGKISHFFKNFISMSFKIKIKSNTQIINIHNAYNSSPVSYAFIDSLNTLIVLRKALRAPGEHIIIGDFNLHHSYGNEIFKVTQHAMTDVLLNIMRDQRLNLTLPKGTITGERSNQFNTIDLILMSNNLREAFVHCAIDRELNQTSDHLFIITKLQMTTETAIIRQKRVGKSMDKNKLIDSFPKDLSQNATFDTCENINRYVKFLTEHVNRAIEASVPGAKNCSKFRFFGNAECEKVMINTRKVRRQGMASKTQKNWDVYLKAGKKKKNVIAKAKKADFKKGMREASESSEKIGRLARWAKNKSHASKKLLKMPILTFDNKTTKKFDEK